jgi:hypothetical protein
MRRRFRGTILVLTAAVPGACGRTRAAPASTVRDSAGVRIVESVRPRLTADQAWRLTAEPLLTIGVTEGDPGYQLSDVVGAVRMPSGLVVVADGGTQEIRVFTAEGTLVRRVGGRGEGPGEFSGLSGMGRGPSGALWAYDFTLRRISWLYPSDESLRSATLGPEPPVLSPVGALPDGSFVLKQLWGAQGVASATHTGLRRDPVAYVRFDPSGALLDTLALVPGREVVISLEGDRGVMSTPPFGRTSLGGILDGRVLIGSQTRFELEEWTPDGTLKRVLRLPDIDLRVTEEDIQRYAEHRRSTASPGEEARVERELADVEVPELRPAYGELLVDGAGNLWIGRWEADGSPARAWTVLDATGTWLVSVGTPSDLQVRDIGEDWVVGVARDELDVERVVLYGLEKD